MREGTATILGVKTHYIETTGSDAVPIIILHGWGSSTSSWKAVAQRFEEKNYRAIIPDLPGFGESGEPKQPWDVHDYVQFVRELAQYFAINTFALAGHSFGGQIALFFASAHPKNVTALIPISAARITGKKRRSGKVRIFAFLTSLGNLVFMLPILGFLRPLVEKIWYKLTGEQDYYRSSSLMREVFKRVINQEATGAVRRITAPTLIIWGAEDDVTPLSDGKRLNNEIAGSQLKVFQEAGHDINLKIPQKIADTILAFLKRHSAE